MHLGRALSSACGTRRGEACTAIRSKILRAISSNCARSSQASRRPFCSLWRQLLCTGVLAICACAPGRAAAFTDPQWVSFRAAPAVPSALARRVLGSALDVARPTTNLRGLLVVPEGDGPFPAVVLLHGCRGVLPSHRGWAHWFARQGFVALLVDSFFTRNAFNVCSRSPDEAASQAVGGRVFDAYGALQYLRADTRVDARRIAVIGWQSWAPLSAVASFGPRVLMDGGFRAAVAVSPQCPLRADAPASPVLIVIGAKDQWHSAHACEQLSAHSTGVVKLAVLPEAGHGFDEVPARAGLLVSMAFDPRLGHAAQVPLRFDGQAHELAAQSILRFLRRELLAGDASDAASSVFHLPHGVRWAVDPAAPGADRPPQGRSLFDRVFADGKGGHRIPFPFAEVLDTLERAIGAPPGSREGLATALIPIGRSLQRSAAAPEFFRFPRLVVAVDGEPADRPRAHFLKDRMFLGYQEKAEVIEVISYNEQAARFEYQVVDNFAPDQTPRVRYANRALCVSCHQNQAPIFARAAWDETNSNPHTARRLRAQRAQFYGVIVRADGGTAARADNATDRANLLPALQLLWREGCGGSAAGAAACRAAALVAMVQYRLSAASGYERDDPMFSRQFAAMFERQWSRSFAHGLAISEADLLNRDPMLEPLPTEIDAHLDPLTARGPAAIWSRQEAMKQLIAELAQSIPLADLGALDAHLRAPAQRDGAQRHEVVLSCAVSSGGRRAQSALIQVRCAQAARDAKGSTKKRSLVSPVVSYEPPTWPSSDPSSQPPALASYTTPALTMEINVDAGRVVDGLVSRVTLATGDRFERLHVLAGTITTDADGSNRVLLRLRQRNGWSVRDHRGHALEHVELRWTADGESRAGLQNGTARMRMVADFAAVRAAVRSLISDAESPGRAAFDPSVFGPSVFGNRSFMPTQVLNVVLRRLNPRAQQWCCETSKLPALALGLDAQSEQRVDDRPGDRPDDRAGDPIVASFRQHCGACHTAATQVPPGFLHGSEAEVMNALRQCAPRIAFRLGMWLRTDDARIRSPMPPPGILPSRGLDEMSWRNSIAFDRLLRWAEMRSGASVVSATGSPSPLSLAKCLRSTAQ